MESCHVCGKNKNKIERIGLYRVCIFCERKDLILKQLINDFRSKKMIEDSTDHATSLDVKTFFNVGIELETVVFKIVNHLEKSYELTENKVKELDKVWSEIGRLNKKDSVKLDSKTQQKILQDLKGLSETSLKECAESLERSEDYTELRQITIEKRIKTKFIEKISYKNPKEIFEELSINLINQDHAKKTIAMAVSKHFCRMKDPTIKKNNILIMGPTGTGKTEIVRLLGKMIDVPIAEIDASNLTAAGYKGNSVTESVINALMSAANNKVELAERSILFIDEIDKKATFNNGGEADIGTVNVQQELLKIIEGGVIRSEVEKKELNTSQVLFIAAGAFSGIESILNERSKNSKGKIGFNQMSPEDKVKTFQDISTDDLQKYGLIPEFLGRFSSLTFTNKLNKDDLKRILKRRDFSIIDNYKKTFKQYDCDIEFSEEFLDQVVTIASATGVGARGLEKVFEDFMQDIYFNVVDYVNLRIYIDKDGRVNVRKKIIASK